MSDEVEALDSVDEREAFLIRVANAAVDAYLTAQGYACAQEAVCLALAAWNTRALKQNTDSLTDKRAETPQKTVVSGKPLVSLERGPTTPEVERLIAQAQFLSDRLDDLDWSMEYDEFGSAYYGHVAPAHSRLKETLAALDAVEAAGGASELKR